eukprot:scaffold27149_cov21-Tisochrysis_lutea.AAC.1
MPQTCELPGFTTLRQLVRPAYALVPMIHAHAGDQEKAIGLPVSPLCDRSNPGITKSQDSPWDHRTASAAYHM